jgi:regulation of enolase protein 1 (concanavalin A-like superfamily)
MVIGSVRLRGASVVAVTAAAQTLLVLTGTGSTVAESAPAAPAYTNPVSRAFADTYSEPTVIRGKDGWWYAFGRTDPLREGEGRPHLLPISRSRDLVSWQYVGDAFTEATMPSWADTANGAALWAPDISYVNGHYRLYYVVTETAVTGELSDNAIGVATASSPEGPWTDSGDPVVDPRRAGGGGFLWSFDPQQVVGPNGAEYLYYGSFFGGIEVTRLTAGGTEATGTPTRVAIDNRYEGASVVWHDGWWYLFVSSANCCAGPTTGYGVYVGRSRHLRGPFVDREGARLDVSRAGGTPVIAPNGNRWVGTGQAAVVTDLVGQDWLVYHAIDRNDPYLDGTDGINERPMLLDQLDWIDGWPTVRAGRWASEDVQAQAPATSGPHVTDFSGGIGSAWTSGGTWTAVTTRRAGTSLRSTGVGTNTVVARTSLPSLVRVEADVRRRAGAGEYGVMAAVNRTRGATVAAVIDPAGGRLVVRSRDGGTVTGARSAPLPTRFSHANWHSLVLEIRGGVATAQLTHARLSDPLAAVSLPLPPRTRRSGPAGVVARGAGVEVDNLSALPAARLVSEGVPVPEPGRLLPGLSDEFNGSTLGPGWTRVRHPQVTVSRGVLRWPVEPADLVGFTNDAGLLLLRPPADRWTAETKLTLDLGFDAVRNFQQGGLIAYVDDDEFARLSHVAIWNTRQTEFGKEMPYAGRLSYGATTVGPPAATTWLRLSHRTAPDGEQLLRASTSRDGRTWVHGGVWTLPAGADIRIGLVSHGGGEPAVTSEFDYFRLYAG